MHAFFLNLNRLPAYICSPRHLPALPAYLQSAQVLDVVDELFSPSKRPDVADLWKSQRERSAWQVRCASGEAVWRRLGVEMGERGGKPANFCMDCIYLQSSCCLRASCKPPQLL